MRPPADTAAAWSEVNEQQALTVLVLGQITCGYSTHRVPACQFCGAIV